MECEKHKNPPQMYKQNLLEALKTWQERAKKTLNSGILGAKSGFGGVRNNELASNLERQNGAKCRFCP